MIFSRTEDGEKFIKLSKNGSHKLSVMVCANHAKYRCMEDLYQFCFQDHCGDAAQEL
jgi:hypothetical protein